MDTFSASLFAAALLLAPLDNVHDLPTRTNPTQFAAWIRMMHTLELVAPGEYWGSFDSEVRWGRGVFETTADLRNLAALPSAHQCKEALAMNAERQRWWEKACGAARFGWDNGEVISDLRRRAYQWERLLGDVTQARDTNVHVIIRRRACGSALRRLVDLPHPLDLASFGIYEGP